MSCCSGGYCKFEFPPGPPLTDNPVADLNAKYLFLPYGTLLEKGELIRIWTEGGQTEKVIIQEKTAIEVSAQGLTPLKEDEFMPWQLVALDSAMEEADLLDFYHHPLYNPEATPVVLSFSRILEPKPSLKETLLHWLYKIRNL